MRNDEEEISRKILKALQKHQQTQFFDKNRLIFSAITGLAIVGFFIWESQPRVNITRLDVYHNVNMLSNKSIKMILDFDTAHLKNRYCGAVAYFYYQNGPKVRSTISGYRTTDNQLSVREDFRPGYEYSTYKDFTLYIPNKYFNSGIYQGEVTAYCADLWANKKTFYFTVGR